MPSSTAHVDAQAHGADGKACNGRTSFAMIRTAPAMRLSSRAGSMLCARRHRTRRTGDRHLYSTLLTITSR